MIWKGGKSCRSQRGHKDSGKMVGHWGLLDSQTELSSVISTESLRSAQESAWE